MSEEDEMRQEDNERRNLRRLNKTFLQFCEDAKRISDNHFNFEIPFRDIQFNGIANRN